jgi:hypothetical protein
LSDSEPIQLRPRTVGRATTPPFGAPGQDGAASLTVFNRQELNEILALYGRMVAMGEWRDYAIDMGRDRAVFSIFRRSSECPLFRIEKNPKMARKQGAYSVVAATGLILKRGHELGRVLRVLEKSPRLVR